MDCQIGICGGTGGDGYVILASDCNAARSIVVSGVYREDGNRTARLSEVNVYNLSHSSSIENEGRPRQDDGRRVAAGYMLQW